MSRPPKKHRTAPRRATISDELRRIIRSRGTPYALSKAAAVSPSILTRFVNGERGLTTDTLDRVADALGLELRETRRGAKRARGADVIADEETDHARDDRGAGQAEPAPAPGVEPDAPPDSEQWTEQ